ncbi:MAG: tRNA 4-thiouridine(8) synthase ThiI [Firmicutes bacterium]|nr:tRNA 4-thiouridine(8) synthase ThiI [Bacillota bacterium]
MNRVVMIKYGELTTKKGNRKFFVNTLYSNIKNKLKGLNVRIHKDISRMYIEFSDSELDEVLSRINNIFGIHEYVVAYKVDTDLEGIKSNVLDIMKNIKFSTFKVETKRSDKSFPVPSLDFSRQLGGLILKNIEGVKVDVHNPEILLNVEIREFFTYIYTNEYKGLGGYPNGTLGNGILMLSGGIDSPVAGYLTLKRGVKLDCIYFEAIPHTSIEARNKVITLAKKLAKYTSEIKLHVVPFTEIQEAIYREAEDDYCITIMRRMMYRITEEVAKRNKCMVIANGESIGQVASQTLTSMSVINEVTNMPVIRPVACLDKLEIIDIAKRIDTYETSILPFEDCCTVFVPKHPVINPKLNLCYEYENRFDYKNMIIDAVNNINTIIIKDEKDNSFEDIL